MKLVKFVIASVEEKSCDEEFYRGFDFSKRHRRTIWNYTINDTEGNTYYLRLQARPVMGLYKNKTIYASVENRGKSNEFGIVYSSGSYNGLMTPQKFVIEVKKDIERRKKDISWNQQEMSRLESLLN